MRSVGLVDDHDHDHVHVHDGLPCPGRLPPSDLGIGKADLGDAIGAMGAPLDLMAYRVCPMALKPPQSETRTCAWPRWERTCRISREKSTV
jgi:hypothetical protein